MDELPEERRDQVERGEPLARDERQGLHGGERRLAHEAAVDGGHAGQRVDAHRVIERHDPERALLPRVAALHDVGDGARVVVAMRAWHALGPARRARRIEDEREVALRDVGRRAGARGRDLLEGQRAGRAALAHRDQTHRGAVGCLGQRGRRGGLAERHARPAVSQHVAQLARRQAEVRRRRHAAERLERPVREHVLQPVAQHEEHTVAAGDAEPAEALGQGARTRGELGIGQPAVAVHDRVGLRASVGGALEEGGQRQGTRRTFPLFFRSSTCCTAARASERRKARSITGFRRPAATSSRTVRSSRIEPRLVPTIRRFLE